MLAQVPSDFVYHPEFDLGIGKKWLPKDPVVRVSTPIHLLNQSDSTNEDDTEFWESLGFIGDSELIEAVAVKKPISPLEKIPSAPEPMQSEVKPVYFHSPKLVS